MPIKKNEHTTEVATRFLEEIDYLKRMYPGVIDRVGIAASYISQIRGGTRSPTIDHLVNMCREYGYSGTWLLTGSGTKLQAPESDPIEQRLEKIDAELKLLSAAMLQRKGKR